LNRTDSRLRRWSIPLFRVSRSSSRTAGKTFQSKSFFLYELPPAGGWRPSPQSTSQTTIFSAVHRPGRGGGCRRSVGVPPGRPGARGHSASWKGTQPWCCPGAGSRVSATDEGEVSQNRVIIVIPRDCWCYISCIKTLEDTVT